MTNINVLIAGGRDYALETRVKLRSANLVIYMLAYKSKDNKITLIQGLAKGADSISTEVKQITGWNELTFKADWDTYGKRAGMVRNKTMVDIADIAIIFWDGKSVGTKNTVERVRSKGIPYLIVYYENKDGVIIDTRREVNYVR